MTRLLLKLPWFVSVPALVALAVALAFAANYTMGGYFERSRLDQADPFAAAGGGPLAELTSALPEPSATPGGGPASPEPTAPVAEPTASNEPMLLFRGDWRDGAPGHSGEGAVLIGRDASGKLVLRVEDFSVTNGPDLVVALSPDDDEYADGSLILGDLKATDGNFNYDIPAGIDVALYKSVVVWCRQFPTTFAYATLEKV